MKFSLAAFVSTSFFLGKTTVLGFSTTTTRANVLTFGEVTEKRARLVEPATQEQRNPAGNSVFWKSFVENLKEAEKLVKDPTVFKQEENLPSINQVPATASDIPSETLTRFILRADEPFEALTGTQTTSIPQANTRSILYYPAVSGDRKSARTERRPISKFPAYVPAQASKMPSGVDFHSKSGDKFVYYTSQSSAAREERKLLAEIESLGAEEVEDDLLLNLPATYVLENVSVFA